MTTRMVQAIVLLLVTFGLLVSYELVAFERKHEKPRNLSASRILPADLLNGEHHAVNDRVKNDGYLNYYTITSEYGEFEAVSTPMLRVRIGELNALAELDELTKTEVFIKAAAEAGIGQIKGIKQFATHPVKSITGIPKGIGRMFRRYFRQAGEVAGIAREAVAGDDDESEKNDSDEKSKSHKAAGLTESVLGVTKAERAWSQKLGTDPYSGNQTLRAAIKEVAWAERLGRFGMGFAGVPKIPGADIIGDVNNVVWSKDPYELQDLNRARLEATGADQQLIDAYLENPRMTPTQRTLLTAAIAELGDVDGRDGILAQALNPQTEAEVGFFVQSMTLLTWYHLNQKPVVSVNTDAAIAAGLTEDGVFVLVVAADHVYWTEDVAHAADRFTGLSSDPATNSREVWVLGSTSERWRKEMRELGWDVHQNVADLLVDVPPKT